MKNKIYHTVRTVIKWGVIYFVFHLTTVRTLRYILFFILRQFEWYGIVNFSFYTCSNGVVYFVFHFKTFRTVWYILFFISWQFERCGIFSFSFYDSSNGAVYLVFHFIPVRIKCKTKYTAPFNCHIMKNKIYHTVRTVIKWKQNIPHHPKCHQMKN
jgi:hypothetical protein